MSDYDYRDDNNYESESISESDIQVEDVTVEDSHSPQDNEAYQKADNSQPDNTYYYDDNSQSDSGSYYTGGSQSDNNSYYTGGSQSDNNSYYAGGSQSDNNSYYDRANRYANAGESSRSNYTHIPEEPQRSRKEPKKKGSWLSGALRVASFAVIFGLVSGATFAGVNSVKEHFFPSPSERIETTTPDTESKEIEDTNNNTNTNNGAASTIPEDVTKVVENVMPSVVSITGTYRTNNYFGFGSQESQGAGSGFLIAENDDKLFLATNNHVVEDSSSLTVGFIDDTTAPATIVGKDSNTDVAVISVNKKDLSDETKKKIKIATLGSSDDLKLGEPVIVIGNALGYGQSVTYGVLSAKDREVPFAYGTMNLLQTDAAINPGNSGGVMINRKGEVVGISNAKLADTSIEGMCYAVPISTAKVILTDLMNAGEIDEKDASYLGIFGKNIDDSYSQALGMPKGIYISQVVSKSPAEDAGIVAGDIIVAMDSTKISTMSGLKERLATKKAGTKVKITVKRANQNGEYEEKKLDVTLGRASDFQDAIENNQSQNNNNNSQDPYGGQGNPGNGYDNNDDYFDNGNGNEDMDPFYYFFR
jgi:serine protease Do